MVWFLGDETEDADVYWLEVEELEEFEEEEPKFVLVFDVWFMLVNG